MVVRFRPSPLKRLKPSARSPTGWRTGGMRRPEGELLGDVGLVQAEEVPPVGGHPGFQGVVSHKPAEDGQEHEDGTAVLDEGQLEPSDFSVLCSGSRIQK